MVIFRRAGTIERAAELKVAQKAVIYALALDDPTSRTPSRTLELERMASDSSKDPSSEGTRHPGVCQES